MKKKIQFSGDWSEACVGHEENISRRCREVVANSCFSLVSLFVWLCSMFRWCFFDFERKTKLSKAVVHCETRCNWLCIQFSFRDFSYFAFAEFKSQKIQTQKKQMEIDYDRIERDDPSKKSKNSGQLFNGFGSLNFIGTPLFQHEPTPSIVKPHWDSQI